ncbi:MAG: DNA-3-methyladenine glycosylase [Candidatus Marsarchaeota archaeon]|nr:DNA-3-methyladenine glycosylase [Candidatus Marsarchaeota archaeon]MCL5111485.1 DNA-3-methyladenine glycosylase [Candidatus Marsarchaeota archaeon]
MEGKIPTIYDRGVWSAAVKHLSKRDKVLAKLIKRLGRIKVNWGGDSYESLMSAIIYQQISGAAGDSIERRFKALYNNRMPSPKRFLATPGKKVRAAGISPQKYSYIVDLCTRIRDGRLELSKFDVMDDEDIIEELDEVKGIGRWTAEMFLMFSLGRTDIVPRDDLGIKKAIKRAYGLREYPTKRKFSELAERWRPYGTIASLYLWRSSDS